MPATKTRPKRLRQKSLPGTEPEVIPEIEAAAEAYREARDNRIEASKEESRTQKELLKAMKKHGQTHYDGETLNADLEQTTVEKVKVTEKGKPPEERDGDE